MKTSTLKLILLAGFFLTALVALSSTTQKVRKTKIEFVAEVTSTIDKDFENSLFASNTKKVLKSHSITDDFDFPVTLIGIASKGILHIDPGRDRKEFIINYNTLKGSTHSILHIDPGRDS